MREKEKKIKSADETVRITKEILDDNKEAQKSFLIASNVDKRKPEPKQKSDQSIP